MADMNWRDKDDLDLTSEDIDAMIAEGKRVGVRGPSLPSAARIATTTSYAMPRGSTTTYRPAASGVRVSGHVPV